MNMTVVLREDICAAAVRLASFGFLEKLGDQETESGTHLRPLIFLFLFLPLFPEKLAGIEGRDVCIRIYIEGEGWGGRDYHQA